MAMMPKPVGKTSKGPVVLLYSVRPAEHALRKCGERELGPRVGRCDKGKRRCGRGDEWRRAE